MSGTQEGVPEIRGPGLWRSRALTFSGSAGVAAGSGRRRVVRLRAALSAAVVVVGTTAVAGFIAISGGATANAAVAPPPAGFTLTWSDDFNGAAGTGLDAGTWKYDTGTGFGTGEIETMTNSTSNVFQDGNGHLV